MTFSLRALAMGALAFGLSACATDTDTAEPLDGATDVVEAAADVPAGVYDLDAAHTEIGFRVRHLGIANVDGTFNEFDGTVTIPETGLADMSASLSAVVASIETDNDKRNTHLKSPDFFAADEHPNLTFVATSVTPTGGNAFNMTGDLTIRGTTQSVTLEGEYLGAANLMGTTKIGFEAEGEINRKDFGLSWAESNDVGEAIVSDTVRLRISVEGNLRAEEGADDMATDA